MTSWRPGRPPADYVVGHVTAVLPDRVVDDARVVVRQARVADVGPHPPGTGCDVDGHGAALLPGLVDVHSDALAREARPRPGITLDPSFALASTGARLRAAGVTTAYHGLAFQERSIVGMPIGSTDAAELSELLRRPGDAQIDHRVLHRLDVRCEHGRALLEVQLTTLAADTPDAVPVVSHEDHTPGQGQFADPEAMRRWLVAGPQMTDAEAAEHVSWWRRDRDLRLDLRDRVFAWLGHLAATERIRLFGHDLATAEEVVMLADRGGSVAEFPTTLEAARAAREHGMFVVAGAPNVLRGGSHTGNVAAAELVAAGLVDALASDYLPTALLPAAIQLSREGLVSLPRAIGLITSGPAACVGLSDRGALREGARADLVLADLDAAWPVVHMVLRP